MTPWEVVDDEAIVRDKEMTGMVNDGKDGAPACEELFTLGSNLRVVELSG